jgi:hypothetical protein
MIEGYVDVVLADGTVRGWARDTTARAPVLVSLHQNGVEIGAATARLFRPDLLTISGCHGHHGFEIKTHGRLTAQGGLELFERTRHFPLARLDDPGLSGAALPPLVQSVESLLQKHRGWSWEHIAAHPGALHLERNLAAMGVSRFVAMSYWFALGRWPGPGEAVAYCRDLQNKSLATDDFLRDLITSAECVSRHATPSAPYDPDFPYHLHMPMLTAPAKPGETARLDAAWPALARLVSGKWALDFEQLVPNLVAGTLLCHPPEHGPAIAEIGPLPAAGLHLWSCDAVLNNAGAQPVCFALLASATPLDAAAVLARLEGSWAELTAQQSRPLTASTGAEGGEVFLYLATRMADDSHNNHCAWAEFHHLRAA